MVALATRVGNVYEITGGLKGDEILAASNLTLLATGVQVKVAPGGAAESQNRTGEAVPGRGFESGRRGGRP